MNSRKKNETDVLIINALKSEYDATRLEFNRLGIELKDVDENSTTPYCRGSLPVSNGDLSICIARPTRMGPTAVALLAGALIEKLNPKCLAMCGVCAGKPNDVSLGDVIVSEFAYSYEEGKRTEIGFEGDHRQIPIKETWLRVAQDMSPQGFNIYGEPTEQESQMWFLELLYTGVDPRKHPARDRYVTNDGWPKITKFLEAEKLIERVGREFLISKAGREFVDNNLAYSIDIPPSLPIKIHAGPTASGSIVVKDGVTWESLKFMGVRSIIGLEMEAAAISQAAYRNDLPYWVVVKGVMDYADPNKDDRYKPFGERASAETLFHFLKKVGSELTCASGLDPNHSENALSKKTNVVGDVKGKNITISQINTQKG